MMGGEYGSDAIFLERWESAEERRSGLWGETASRFHVMRWNVSYHF